MSMTAAPLRTTGDGSLFVLADEGIFFSARRQELYVFPHYQPDVRTELRPIMPSDALRRLLHECTSLPQLLDERRVERLIRWMRKIACFELPMSSLDEAVEYVRRCCTR